MLFSVIIPTYNRAALLHHTLDSVLAQTLSSCEIIVVDDGSTDQTEQVVAALGGKIRFLRQPNLGPGAARNLGAGLAAGQYLTFLDSDDLWFPWTLETYQKIIKQNQSPSFLAGKPFRFQEESELQKATGGEPKSNSFPDYLASGDEWRWWGASSFVVRREAFAAVGGFTPEPVNGEDADLALRLGVSQGFVQVTSPVTFAYREHASSVMSNHPKTLAGLWLAIHAEQAGQYPGGQARAQERWRILTRHGRPATVDCLRLGSRKEAWQLYRAMFRWNWTLGNLHFLIGFPIRASARLIQ